MIDHLEISTSACEGMHLDSAIAWIQHQLDEELSSGVESRVIELIVGIHSSKMESKLVQHFYSTRTLSRTDVNILVCLMSDNSNFG